MSRVSSSPRCSHSMMRACFVGQVGEVRGQQVPQPPAALGGVLGRFREEVEEPVVGGDHLEAHEGATMPLSGCPAPTRSGSSRPGWPLRPPVAAAPMVSSRNRAARHDGEQGLERHHDRRPPWPGPAEGGEHAVRRRRRWPDRCRAAAAECPAGDWRLRVTTPRDQHRERRPGGHPRRDREAARVRLDEAVAGQQIDGERQSPSTARRRCRCARCARRRPRRRRGWRHRPTGQASSGVRRVQWRPMIVTIAG